MFCNECAVASELYACSDAIIVGSANPDTDYYVFLRNNTTGLESRFDVTSDNTGLITWDLPANDIFATGLSYTLWVTTTAANDKVEIQSGDDVFTCIDLTFTQLFDEEGCCVCFESQTIKVKIMQEDECKCILKQVKYLVGVAGTANTDHNFVLAANNTLQSIQLGNSNIIPVNAQIIGVTIRNITSTQGATALADVGNTSGGNEFLSSVNVSNSGDTFSIGSNPNAQSAASSVYFSITPNVNWNDAQMLTGKWEIRINYLMQQS